MVLFFAVLQQFRADRHGVTAIEYGMIAALVAVALVTALTAVGGSLNNIFTTVASSL